MPDPTTELTPQQHLAKFEGYMVELSEETEKRLGLPKHYIWTLRTDGSDWEFIIRLAVLAEAAVTRALVSVLDDERMFAHVTGLTQAKRLQLCKELNVLDDAARLIFESLARTRNQFAHKVENLNRSLQQYVDGLKQQDKVDLANRLLLVAPSEKYTPSDDLSWLGKRFRKLMLEAAIVPFSSLATTELKGEAERMRRQFASALDATGNKQSLADLFKI